MKKLLSSIVKPFGKTIINSALSTITSIIVGNLFCQWWNKYKKEKQAKRKEKESKIS